MSRIELKRQAFTFLQDLHRLIQASLPHAASMRIKIGELIETAKNDPTKRHLGGKEWAFLNHFVTPVVYELAKQTKGMTGNTTRTAFLSEFWNNADIQPYCEKSASRTARTPFIKKLMGKGSDLFNAWKAGKLERACPDFALSSPFPYPIVFEGKYFDGGSITQAETVLVDCIREAFFYRSFPYSDPGPIKGEWSYDYSCLLVCDASENGSLLGAWNQLPLDVREAFWDGANVFVMIVRGGSDVGSSP